MKENVYFTAMDADGTPYEYKATNFHHLDGCAYCDLAAPFGLRLSAVDSIELRSLIRGLKKIARHLEKIEEGIDL